ncbi:MAG TPA: sporulation protein YqfD [Candidatus Mediterraneibacter cottocaccae]|nr:sporulation protein YqfD [Candidatus Mediterraneibacter cottocaccae]
MIRSLIRYLKGYVKIRVEGYSPERFLNMCCFHHILIWGLYPADGSYELYMQLSGFRRIRPFVRKTHTKVTVMERFGFPFFLARYRRRKLFFGGLLLCIFLIYGYSLFIWDIHFEGNERWTDETLTEFLASEGVAPGMLKRTVDCPEIVKEIRTAYNDIVWVSASIDGSRLKIQIKENDDTFRKDTVSSGTGSSGTASSDRQNPEGIETAGEGDATDLIASSDGTITEIITRSGVPQVHAGDQVKAGDILVLGRIEVKNDSGEVIGYQYQHSDADIYADTQMEYSDSVPLTEPEKTYDGKKRFQFFFRFFGWTASVGTVRNSFENCEIYTKEIQMKAGENFYLPFSFGFKEARSYTAEERTCTQEELQKKLSLNFRRFCEDLEEKGIHIRGNSVKIHIGENSADASGTIYLNERITREADTEILTIERKEPDEPVGTDD